MSSSTLREARNKYRSYCTELQRDAVNTIVGGTGLNVDLDKLEQYQRELRSLQTSCDGWKQRVITVRNQLDQKEDALAYREAESLIDDLGQQHSDMGQVESFFKYTHTAVGTTEQRAVQSVRAGSRLRAHGHQHRFRRSRPV